jgi:hypothetical protein
VELPGIELVAEIALTSGNVEIDDAKVHETTRDDLAIRERCGWHQHCWDPVSRIAVRKAKPLERWQFEQLGGAYDMHRMREGGGMTNATIIERVCLSVGPQICGLARGLSGGLAELSDMDLC